MLAGVARGIAENFGISDWIPRVFFVITAFMGGFGVVLYAAGWAFIRSEDEAQSPAERFFSGASTSRAWLGVGLIVIAGMIVLARFTFLTGEVIWAGALLVVGLLLYLGYIPGRRSRGGPSESKEGVQRMTTTDTDTTVPVNNGDSDDSPAGGSIPRPPTPPPTPPARPPTQPREGSVLGRITLGVTAIGLGVLAILDNLDALAIDAQPYHYLALAVTIIGVGLLVGAFAGRARWLILVLALLIPTLIFSPFFRSETRRADLRVRPATFSELDTSYDLDVGQLVIDLTDLPWNGQEIDLDANVDVGSVVIRLPEDVGIDGSANVDIGQVSDRERTSAGIGNPQLEWNESGSDGTVMLDAHVSLGEIEIKRDPGGLQ